MKKKIACFTLLCLMTCISIEIYAQGGGGGGLYTFKYVLKPMYKTRTKINHKSGGDEDFVKYEEVNFASFFKDYFEKLIMGTGYTRRFNITDVINDGSSYWWLGYSNATLRDLRLTLQDVIPIYPEIKDVNKLGPEYFLKFNYATYRLDLFSNGKFSSSASLLLPTFKRKLFDNEEYIKFKYGIDVLYYKQGNKRIPYRLVGKNNTTLSHPLFKFNTVSKTTDSLVIVPWYRRKVARHYKKNEMKLIQNVEDGQKGDTLYFDAEIVDKGIYQDTFYIELPKNYNVRTSIKTVLMVNLILYLMRSTYQLFQYRCRTSVFQSINH